MSRRLTVEAINLPTRTAVLSDGTVIPVVALYGRDSEECDDPNEAVTAVAGSDEHCWWALDLSDFTKGTMQ